MKNIIFILIAILTTAGNAQTFKVIDIQTSEPVPFASVYLVVGALVIDGVSCNENGEAALPKREFETLKISCIGYEDLLADKTQISSGTLYLHPKDVELNEIVIENKTATTLTYKGRKGRDLGMFKNEEIILYFRNPYKRPVLLKSFTMQLKKAIVKNTLRMIVYKVQDTLKHYKPGANMLHEDILFKIEPGEYGIKNVDLTSQEIYLPAEGAYIGIEVIESKDINGNYSYDKNHMNEFETIEYNARFHLINRKFTSRGWQNAQYEWERSVGSPKKWKNRRIFVLPAWSIEVYTD